MIAEMNTFTRVVGPMTNIAAAGAANAAVVLTQPAAVGQVGVKTFRMKKAMVRNNAGGLLWVQIGTGVAGAYVDLIPPFILPNNADQEMTEFDLPAVETNQNITAFPSALLAGSSIDIQLEAEERG